MVRLTRKRRFDIALFLFAIFYAALIITPVSWWYELGEIEVIDAREGEPILIVYHGGATREFLGSYSVVVRDFATRGIVCEGRSGRFVYEVGAPRPDPLSMAWWAPSDPRCAALPAGTYVMETCWTVYSPFWGLVPSKTECLRSPAFTIHPKD
ncbi:hypothetical protein FHS89_001771 [Rubricella aquisinus]|uniref:Uncharacterized protein n=1 Tax=Rubricella aquisinus TaxID=2028108 RepID=A0A840WMG4_9RHOB|nr:hypothetical protein [Rubricella aquisinus]MBB5515751.1 hypothetical protein [Rubricella aquisinus]